MKPGAHQSALLALTLTWREFVREVDRALEGDFTSAASRTTGCERAGRHYLADLSRILHGSPEEAEVLAAVRAHFEQRLGSDSTLEDVDAAIAELGPPEGVAGRPWSVQRAWIRRTGAR
ncbi:hypothetical protein CUD01_28160 [Cellulomonas uda]|uniref:Uncharacterized protein n=1 Tax=Cellulomonas uda TaxID=1714 RepID=A0A4Y3KEH7_CELUD|nr:hypothetical protein CUD01_28160 [Cellulomonas uda]